MNHEEKRGKFSGQLGFILAAAGSAVGLGNIWRFPYLAAKDGGGIFILCYLILAITFGFALLTTEIAIGRKTGQSPLTAYRKIHPKWGGIGALACLVPVIILPYYCSIGGWVFKYLFVYLTGNGEQAVQDGFFTGYITSFPEPIIWMLIYFGITAFIVYSGVEKGIERYSKILMPVLVVMIIGISVFAMTLKHTDAEGITRTGLQGLKVYLIPDFKGLTLKKLLVVIMDAMGAVGGIIGAVFFIIVSFAAVTSSVSVMEAIVSSLVDRLGYSRKKSTFIVTIYALIVGIIVCLGYNYLYFEVTLPNGSVGQILDIMDYLSNNIFMPLVALLESILIGWIVKPDLIIEEVTQGKIKFGRCKLYVVMIRFVVPFMLLVLLLQAVGLF